MRTFLLQIIWLVAITVSMYYKTAGIVAASLGTVVVVTLILMFFLIRRRIRITCVLQQKQSADTNETPSSKMHPDIEAASGEDSEYAEIYLDSLDPMKREDNVYQTIDQLPEQNVTPAKEYDHLNENTSESSNKTFLNSVNDSQSESVVQDNGHIVKTKVIPGGYLTLETNKSDTSNDNIRMTKEEVNNKLNVMESTYNSTQHERNQAGTSNSDVGNYSLLHPESTHDFNKTMHLQEVMTDTSFKAVFGEPEISNTILVDKETGFCLKEADVKPQCQRKCSQVQLWGLR